MSKKKQASTALSLGTDTYELLELRGQTIPGAARFLSAGRGITMHEPGRITIPHWISSPEEGRKAVEELLRGAAMDRAQPVH